MTDHVKQTHPLGASCSDNHCSLCSLFTCAVCGGAEGALPSECPGSLMPSELLEDVYADLLDYRNEHWFKPRWLLVHREWGVFLGSGLGLGIWSQIDPAGQDSAVTFETKEECKRLITDWHPEVSPMHFWFRAVESENGYASMDACVDAGITRWDGTAPNEPPYDGPKFCGPPPANARVFSVAVRSSKP